MATKRRRAKRAKRKKARAVWSEKDKARVTALVEKWSGLLMLNGHHISVEFSETARVDEEGRPSLGACADMDSNFPYMSGHAMTVYPRFLDEKDAGTMERNVIHELMHIITFPQRELTRRLFKDKFVTADECRNTCETTTDWLANIVWALYESRGGRDRR